MHDMCRCPCCKALPPSRLLSYISNVLLTACSATMTHCDSKGLKIPTLLPLLRSMLAEKADQRPTAKDVAAKLKEVLAKL